MAKLFPVLDRLVVKVDEPVDKTPGGIVLPDCAQEKTCRGTVVAVGPGPREDREAYPRYGGDGEADVCVHDKVFFPAFAGNPVTVGGEELLVLRESDILLVVEE